MKKEGLMLKIVLSGTDSLGFVKCMDTEHHYGSICGKYVLLGKQAPREH